jgi:hypothetical protein
MVVLGMAARTMMALDPIIRVDWLALIDAAWRLTVLVLL